MRGKMPRFRLTWTLSEYGDDPANGERFLEGFAAVHPDVGPVVSQNTETGRLSVTFSLEAKDASDALEKGLDVFVKGAAKSGLPPTDVIDVSVTAIARESREEELELVPA